MALVPGTIKITSGVAADTPSIVFCEPDGTPVSAPVSNPVVQAGGTGSGAPYAGLVSVPGKGYMLVEPEATAPVRVWDADHVVLADLFSPTDFESGFAAASLTAFYTCRGVGSALILHKINATTGADEQAWDLSAFFAPTTDKPTPSGLAIKPDGTRAYVFYKTDADAPQVVVINLSGVGSLVTDALLDLSTLYAAWPVATGWQANTNLSSNFIITPDGTRFLCQMQTNIGDTGPDVTNVAVVWTIAGAFVKVINAPDNEAPDGLFQGYRSDTFWRYIDTPMTLEEVDIEAETILNTIDVVSGLGLAQGAFGGYSQIMAIVRGSFGQPVPNPTPLAPQTPCEPESDVSNGGKGHFGCNTGGVGWTSMYPDGPYDTVPQHDDPVDGETFTNKRRVDFWMEWRHRNPSTSPESIDPYYRAKVELGHLPSYEGGRKQEGLKTLGRVSHAIGNELHAFETGDVSLEYGDQVDRLIRSIADGQSLRNDELLLKGASPEGVALATPPRILARALVQQARMRAPMGARLEAVDQISTYFNTRKYPHWTFRDLGAAIPNAPQDTLDLPITPLYGEKSDANPTSGISRGLIPGIFCGLFDLSAEGLETPPETPGFTFEAFVAALQASHDAETLVADWGGCLGIGDMGMLQGMDAVPTDYFTLGSLIGFGDLDATLSGEYDCGGGGMPPPDDTGWGLIVFGLAEWFRLKVYGSDLSGGNATTSQTRVAIDPSSRSDILHPDYTWPFPNRYLELTNPDTGRTFWVMAIFVRGPLLDDHINGRITITANAIGIMGNAGLPLIDAHACEQHWHENFVQNDWSSGPWTDEIDFPQWSDGTPKVNTTTFAECQALSATLMGGSPLGRGLTVGWFPKEVKTLKACVDDWDRDTETKTGFNGHWQTIKFRFNPDMDTSGFTRVDHAEHVFGAIQYTPGQDPINVRSGACDWDPDGSKFRATLTTPRRNEEGIAYQGEELLADPIASTILNDLTQLAWVIDQSLLRLRFGSTFIDVPRDLGAWDHDVASGHLLTTIEGTGAIGFVGRRCIKLRRELDLDTRIVTDTLWDVERLLTP